MRRHPEPRMGASPVPDEATIVAGMRAGASDEFGALFLSYYDTLCRFAAGYTASWSDAEELVETLFARLWETRTTFDPQHGVAAYLFSSVRNRAYNVRRDAKIRATVEHHMAAEPT